MPVGENDDLPVVADLEELLDPAVQEPDLRFAGDDPVAVELEAQSQGTVHGGVVRSQVEHDVVGVGGLVGVVESAGRCADAGGEPRLPPLVTRRS